jgi:predicted nucleic acid-binding protein
MFIGHLNLLKLQFAQFGYPMRSPWNRLFTPTRSVALAATQKAIRDQWIKTAASQHSPLLSVLLSSLHKGEAEAIVRAGNLKADIEIIDEQEGRQLASHAGLSVTGVLGLLLRAKLAGHIPAVKPEMQALQHKAHFFIAPSLEAWILVSIAGLIPILLT